MDERFLSCLACLIAASICSAAEGSTLPTVYDLRCQHMPGSPSIDVDKPTLSWKHPSQLTWRDSRQTAWQVVLERFGVDGIAGVLWDSGKVEGDDDYSVPYGGPPLQSATNYQWKVRWWDQDGESSPFTDYSLFHVALLNENDWASAKWIAASGAKTAPYMVNQFTIQSNEVSSADLYFTGLGFFDLYVNGQRLTTSTEHALVPGWTNYEKRVFYLHFDLKEIVKAGNNSVAVMLGYGWRDTGAFAPKDGKNPNDTEPRVLRMKLQMTLGGGSVSNVYSDDTWRWEESPITSDSIYNGETYDARLEKAGWNLPTADLSDWQKATVVNGPSGNMTLQTVATIKATSMVKPVNVTKPQENTYVVDFGENLSGRCQIQVKGKAGDTVTMHHAEILVHPPYGDANGMPYFANLRGAKATDVYILKGDSAGEVYEPRFTYHGFRYVQIDNYPGVMTAEDITLLHIHTSVNRSGVFNTSSKVINAIQNNVWSGQESNLMSVITDCDQRDERLGWMGDAGLSADSFAINFDMRAFFPNMLSNIRDEQGEDGSIPDVVPFYKGGGRPADPSWSAAFPQVCYVLSTYYGDSTTVSGYLDALQSYIKEVTSRVPSGGLSKMPGPYGDWCPPPPSRKVSSALTSSFSFINNMKQVANMLIQAKQVEAGRLMLKDVEKYVAKFNDAFLSNGSHYLNDLQTSYALALALEADPSTQRAAIQQNFLNSIKEAKNHLTTGIIGTKYIIPVLASLQQLPMAQEIIEQIDYPSWGWMAFNNFEPATTIWELWNAWESGPGMNSRNHHMFSSISHWLRTHSVGFVPTAPGLKNITFLPAEHLGLSWAETSIDEPRFASLRWHRSGGVQCGKAPESQSHFKPLLPSHDGLTLTCGEGGGIIDKVEFASFGTPTGRCQMFMKDSKCHHPNSTSFVEQFCLGKAECTVPTGGELWGEPCEGVVARLYVEVTCSQAIQTHTSLTVPVGGTGVLFLPAHGVRSPQVRESGQLVWSEGRFVSDQVAGVRHAAWDSKRASVRIEIGSGRYEFHIGGPAVARERSAAEKN